jgi:hypothetical protein
VITYVIIVSTAQKHIDPAATSALNCVGVAMRGQLGTGSKFRVAEG